MFLLCVLCCVVTVHMTPIARPGLSRMSAPSQLMDTPGSDTSTMTEADTSSATASPAVLDQDIARMEAQLDDWSFELKRNVLVSVWDDIFEDQSSLMMFPSMSCTSTASPGALDQDIVRMEAQLDNWGFELN